jgi:hypothetical protein
MQYSRPLGRVAVGAGTATARDVREVLNDEQALEADTQALEQEVSVSIDLRHTLHEQVSTGLPDDRVDTDTIGAFKTKPNHNGVFHYQFVTD